jgi:hypothetical protein
MKSAWMVVGRALALALLVLAGDGCSSSKHPANPDGGDAHRDVVEVPQSEAGGTDVHLDTPVEHVCPTTGTPKPMGEACECASQCASGFCVGGFCCATACNPLTATTQCTTGTCAIVACTTAASDCDGIADTGCETPWTGAMCGG